MGRLPATNGESVFLLASDQVDDDGVRSDYAWSVAPWRDWGTSAAKAEWEQLVADASTPNPFFEPWFLLPSCQEVAPDIQIATLRRDGQLIALMPLQRLREYGNRSVPYWGNWIHPNAFCGTPLTIAGAEKHFAQALLSWADEAPGTALFLHLSHLPADVPFTHALLSVVREEGRGHAVVHREQRAMLTGDLSAEDYLAAAMTGKKRKELRRQRNRLAEEGRLGFARQTDAVGLEGWITSYLALEQRGWKGREGSALACDPANATLFRTALSGAAHTGRLERLTLTLDDTPIAMLANFLTPPGSYSFKTCYDEDYARFSPGVLLQLENLALLDRADIAWCDSCAAADHPMIDRIWRDRREMLRISLAIGGRLRRLAYAPMLAYETRNRNTD